MSDDFWLGWWAGIGAFLLLVPIVLAISCAVSVAWEAAVEKRARRIVEERRQDEWKAAQP